MNFKQILSFAIGPIGAAALGLLSVPIAAWLFTPEDIGKMSLVVVIASFCNLVFNLGLDQAYVREYFESKNKPRLLRMTFFPGFLILIFFLLILILFSTQLLQIAFGISDLWTFLVISLYILTVYISRYVTLILRMQGRGFAYSISQFTPKLLLIMVFASYWLLSLSIEFKYLIIANFIALFLTTLFYIWSTRVEWQRAIASTTDIAKLKSMLVFGTPLIFASLFFWGITSLDRIFLRYYSGFEELGIYSVSVNFAGVAIILQSVFSTVWAPIVYKWLADGDDLNKVFSVTYWMVVIIGLFFSLSGLFSWLIPYLLPANFSDVQYIFIACLGYPLFYTLSETTVVGINITKTTKYAMFAAFIALCINIICNYILVPLYGAKGAAISTAVSFWFFFVARTELANRVWVPIKNKNIIHIVTLVYLLMIILFVLFGDNYFTAFFYAFLFLAISCSFSILLLFKNVRL
ncbi:oligosaccharide flippase family protein [Shewanella frigidimarina]|uniref:lipopolysaccharide biosynthesis protein n=1 Tax=Shewanella frigidimarina TaxID=56812 RepID=UPI003D790D66